MRLFKIVSVFFMGIMIGIMIAGAVAAHANEKSWDDKFKNAYVAHQNAIEQDWTDAG